MIATHERFHFARTFAVPATAVRSLIHHEVGASAHAFEEAAQEKLCLASGFDLLVTRAPDP
jgi:hypothetical protein